MGQRFLANSEYAGRLSANPEQMRSLVTQMISAETAAVFVAERAGALIGMIGLLRFTHPLSAECFVSELFWWVEPEYRGAGVRLLRRGERWAVEIGAVKVQMIAPNPLVGRLYERCGYVRVEAIYQRTVRAA
jgi:GNAT superfamily N-acetyltransferase